MTWPESHQAKQRPGQSLVFVAGLHRSGTTPLTRLLGMHPQVSTFRDTGAKEDEGQHLQDVYPSARAYGGAGQFAFAAQAHLTERSPLATPANAQALFESWAPYWDLSRPFLVEKSPPNLLMTRFLQALFPAARIVVIVRHPVVVALSTRRWAGPAVPLSRLLEHWVHSHTTFLADAGHINHLHVVQYEQLVEHPEPALHALGDFLQLDGPIPVSGLQRGRSGRYEAQWQELLSSRRVWRRSMARRLQKRFEAQISRFGYSTNDLAAFGPFPKPDRFVPDTHSI